MKVINDNFAPNGFTDPTDSGDCVIRAVSYALDISYEDVCKVFGIKYDDYLECADAESLKANPISFKKIRNASKLPFSKHVSFLDFKIPISHFFKKSWTAEEFIEKKPKVFANKNVVLYLFPKVGKKGHAVVVSNGVVHDNRPDGSLQQKRELTEYSVLGYSIA